MLTKTEFFTRFTTVLPGSNSASGSIYFTPIGMEGLEEMHSYSVKEQFYEFFEFSPFQDIKETESYLQKLLDRMTGNEDDRVTTYWFVRRRSDDRLVGSAGLIDLNFGRQSIEWGYGIDPDLWGQGYILKIQETLKDYVFNILELNRIHGVTMSTNLRTIESVTAAGMTHEGIAKEHYCKNGEFIDGWRYGMTRSMYEDHQLGHKNSVVESDRVSSIVRLVASVFPEEEITEDSSMEETDSWDSLGHMQVIVALKDELNIELSPSHISEATSIRAITDIINEVL